MDVKTTLKQKAPLIGGLLACVAVYVYRAWPSLWSLVDDAWVSARYASNAAAGNGLVYNVGEPPIEGFTNLLWTLWLVPAHFLPVSIDSWMALSGLFWGTMAVVFTGMAARALQPKPSVVLPVLASLVVALDVHHAVSSTNGLETSLFTAACVGSLWACTQARQSGSFLWAGMALATLPLIRPEGWALSLLLLAATTPSLRFLPKLHLPLLGSLVGSTAWRLWTYGTFVPNTFAAKANGSWSRNVPENLAYLGTDLLLWVGPSLALLLALFTLQRASHARIRLAVIVAILAMAAAAMRVDLWMPGARLFVPSTALLTVLAFSLRSRVVAGIWLLVALAAPFTSTETHNRRYDKIHSVHPPNGVSIAIEHIMEHIPEGAWVSTRDAGLVAYLVGPGRKVAETHHRALTQLHPDGKNADVLSYTPKNPDLVVLTQAAVGATRPRYGPDRRLFRRLDVPYIYLGRVRQHHKRHYDLYVRADRNVPPLPADVVVNRKGQPGPNSPARSKKSPRGAPK